ncbi:uncharacterized protein LOC113562157 [Ooceraea biroi]|uniref:uncharacterized protein LOC113562157 n=1 Tax=Ooceraea biroi TaxID=2015173 RepID=UPI000F080899|nr:uncharacterized protein LOC113562157 [Ooceraea biroi]
MDIQFVGEKSTLLTWYTTKYVSKAEKSNNAEDTFQKINSTKSLSSCLWNIGVRMLNHRECGALEAADTLLGISLYGTDKETTIRWLDVNMIRSRKVKSHKEIEMLNSESTDIFCPSLIDTYYPSRPKELESTNLYEYTKWYDITKDKPISKKIKYYVLGESLYLRKRKRGYLINHYEYNVHTQPERYYFSLLLLFQPWRDISELKNECDRYAETFSLVQFKLKDALQYHEKITVIQQGIDNIKELIQEKISEIRKDEEENYCPENCALECVPVEVEGTMRDFKDINEDSNKFEVNVDEMVTQLNTDQKRIFDRITAAVSDDNNEVLRLYVSGEGGTGKSFLIKTIRCWIKKYIGDKDTAVTAPTGIAAFNIDGLTIHRLFQLPVEHGRTAKYKQLSDIALKVIRDELKNVVLIIIDEVSMILNITLMYIHLRLTEIFNTMDCDNGWFGKNHILLFGDLLQLPPVHENPPFIKLAKLQSQKYVGAMGSVNLWSLFSYDELQINVRQQGDDSYRDILTRIRVETLTDSDVIILETRKINFRETNCDDRLQALCNYLQNLPMDTVCLLPTCALCDVLNTAMLDRISSDKIELIAEDLAECASYLKKNVMKILNKDDEDSSRTAGLARIITVKVGARVMLRRNIDISLGLVNGTIGTIISIIHSAIDNKVEKIKIRMSSGIEHIIERLSVKFEVMDRAFVIRKQFPICLSYDMTIHKSQGLSLKHAVVEAGNSIFSWDKYMSLFHE